MCILTTEEEEAMRKSLLKVSGTNIFARHTKPGYQAIAYSMSVASSSRAAMILPLPVVPGSGEDALKFIDLSEYPDFFDDLSNACEYEVAQLLEESFDFGSEEPQPMLAVHEVGDYEASYVPAMADFNRLDSRFRLADEIWEKMPDYTDYGFAVFQLKISLSTEEKEAENDIHPMAFEFPSRNSEKLFYPTVHVHDGDYHREAFFHHTLFCQRDNARSEFKYQIDLLKKEVPTPAVEFDNMLMFDTGYDWFLRSNDTVSNFMKIDKCQGVVAPNKKLYGMVVRGEYPNFDIWLGDTA